MPDLRAPAFAALIGPWRLDPARTAIRVRTTAWWLLSVAGVITAVRGQGTVHPDGTATGTITLDVASLSTGSWRRDRRIRSAKFLDTDTFPTVFFKATTQARGGSRQLLVTGELTAHGITRPLTVPARPDLTGTHTVISATSELDRRDWNVNTTTRGRSFTVAIDVSVHFAKEHLAQGTSWTHL